MSRTDDEGGGRIPPHGTRERAADAAAVGEWLGRLAAGEERALDELLPLVYGELRTVARRLRRRQSLEAPTWNTTAVVHEAYLKLARASPRIGDRVHFFAVASTAMRQLLVDEARKRGREKRGGGLPIITLTGRERSADEQRTFLLALDEALEAMGRTNPRLRRVVDCRYFGGLTEEETAEALDCSVRTVRRDWALARARLALLVDRAPEA